MPEVLSALMAFVAEHQCCGELDGGRDGGSVWLACSCGAQIVHPASARLPKYLHGRNPPIGERQRDDLLACPHQFTYVAVLKKGLWASRPNPRPIHEPTAKMIHGITATNAAAPNQNGASPYC
jgi:hypothetical protein